MQSLPWWETLPEDFNASTHHLEIDDEHYLKIKSTAAIDRVLRTGLASIMTIALSRTLLMPKGIKKELDTLEFYKDFTDSTSHAKAFPDPPKIVEINTYPRSWLSYRPKEVDHVELLSFESPYVALNPALRTSYAQHKRNHQVVGQYWRHNGQPKPTLIFIHGVVVDAYRINTTMFSLRWFYKQGYNVLLYTLPFHGYRHEAKNVVNGMGYFSHGLAHANEAMLQAVYDLRIWMNYLEQQGTPSMGVMGLSLGGYISSLAASVDNRLAFVIPYAPVVSPIDMLLEWQPTSWTLKRVIAKYGVSVSNVRHLSAIHNPLTWQPVIDPKRLMIIGGAGDRFVNPRYLQVLHEHWKGSQLDWFPGNHLIYLDQARILKKMKKFMDECCQS